MKNIVELREMGDAKLQEMLNDGREKEFNLRFQRASGQLEDYTHIKKSRREKARIQSVLHMRELAVAQASANPEIAKALAGQEWEADANYSYEEKAWLVNFMSGKRKLATAHVNLNARGGTRFQQLVTRYEIAG